MKFWRKGTLWCTNLACTEIEGTKMEGSLGFYTSSCYKLILGGKAYFPLNPKGLKRV